MPGTHAQNAVSEFGAEQRLLWLQLDGEGQRQPKRDGLSRRPTRHYTCTPMTNIDGSRFLFLHVINAVCTTAHLRRRMCTACDEIAASYALVHPTPKNIQTFTMHDDVSHFIHILCFTVLMNCCNCDVEPRMP